MDFYREKNLPRELKLERDFFTLTHKSKPMTDLKASTLLLQFTLR